MQIGDSPKIPDAREPKGQPENRPRQKLSAADKDGETLDTGQVKEAVKNVSKFDQLQVGAPAQVALDALISSRDWIPEMMDLLASIHDEKTKDRTFSFLASDQASAAMLRALAEKKEYEKLNQLIPDGQKLYDKLMGG